MPWTQAERDALASAIASGVRRVRLGGRETEFHDLGEMRKLLAEMDGELASPPPRNHHLAVIKRGT